MKPKFFAFDIDGTLLDTNKQPLPSTVAAITALRKQGHFVTLATGRSRFHAQPVITALQFDNYVLCNGAAAFLSHQQVYKQLLPQKALHDFVNETGQLGIDTSFIGLDAMGRASNFDLPVMQLAMRSFGADVPDLDVDFATKVEIYQGLAFYDRSYAHYFDAKYPNLDFVRWHEHCVDVVSKKNSKATTILKVAQQIGIAKEDVICFGDGMNDRQMLQAAGIGVAMGNATAEVQACADYVTTDNDHDGIYQALEKMAFI